MQRQWSDEFVSLAETGQVHELTYRDSIRLHPFPTSADRQGKRRKVYYPSPASQVLSGESQAQAGQRQARTDDRGA